jgi:hypothetical protein
MQPIRTSFWVLVLYDVSEEIDLDQVRLTLGVRAADREPSFRHPTPEYVRFQRPPVIQAIQTDLLESGEPLAGQIKFFDYGVISVLVELRVEVDWEELIALSSRWINAPEIERKAAGVVRAHAEPVRAALIKPHSEWLSEDYYIVQVRDLRDANGQPASAAELLANCGGQVAQIVRGESKPLSQGERQEVLQSSMSYYPTDLLVVGWTAALVYDTPEGAAPTIQLLEYANTQLLEFRHYDAVLTDLLADVYRQLERKHSFFRRWGLARKANDLNAIRLDVTELTERIDNSIKFLSDMFYARAYRLAAEKIGVTDYRNLVDEKLRTAGELYNSMVNEFHQARAFVLESMVVAILVIELIFLFRGQGR